MAKSKARASAKRSRRRTVKKSKSVRRTRRRTAKGKSVARGSQKKIEFTCFSCERKGGKAPKVTVVKHVVVKKKNPQTGKTTHIAKAKCHKCGGKLAKFVGSD